MNDPRRLRRILEVKERVRDLHRGTLAEEDRALDSAVAGTERARRTRSAADAFVRGGPERDARDLQAGVGLAEVARRGIALAERRVEACRETREDARRRVEDASREVRSLEAGIARLERRVAIRVERAERAQTDDLVAGRHGRDEGGMTP